MCARRQAIVWRAEPHTIAKIAILKSYLFAWLQIFGRTWTNRDLLYVDGFAGPGSYSNHSEGSPIAALLAARQVLDSSGQAWRAGVIHCAFIESEQRIARHLEQAVQPFQGDPRLRVHVLHATFADGIEQLQAIMPRAFSGAQPLFVFVDPFGATGVPFATIRNILASATSEVLINLDADGFVRILRAGAAANRDELLTTAFDDQSWQSVLDEPGSTHDQAVKIAELYKDHLRALPALRYVYSFEMLTSRRSVGQSGYFLIFASQHPKGLLKMKESMRSIDQTGSHQFSSARVGRPLLIRFDRPEDFAPGLLQQFAGRGPVSYPQVLEFVLNQTPFASPKPMLHILDVSNSLKVDSTNPRRRKGTFNEDTILSIEFLEDPADG